MKKFLLVLAVAAIFATTASAGGPDVKKLPKVKTVPLIGQQVAPMQEVIQPIPEMRAVKSMELKKMEMPAQPSDARVAGQSSVTTQAMVVKEKKVTVLFESEPAKAELLINGLYVGSTPIQVPLKKGVHNIKYILSGHSEWDRQVIVYQGLRVLGVLDKAK